MIDKLEAFLRNPDLTEDAFFNNLSEIEDYFKDHLNGSWSSLSSALSSIIKDERHFGLSIPEWMLSKNSHKFRVYLELSNEDQRECDDKIDMKEIDSIDINAQFKIKNKKLLKKTREVFEDE